MEVYTKVLDIGCNDLAKFFSRKVVFEYKCCRCNRATENVIQDICNVGKTVCVNLGNQYTNVLPILRI